tara:strand:+ start:929 stop:1300 length:372 start_codon:yes stop_codon:yes gene_type:complete
MNKKQLRDILRPMIEECVKELFFEKGFMSNMIQEVVEAQSKILIKEEKPYQRHLEYKAKSPNLDSVASSYGDVPNTSPDPTPVKKATGEYKKYGAMKDVDPSNPGVSIDKLLEGMNFKALKND